MLPAFIKKLVKDIVTETNGEDFDVARVLWILGALVFLGLAVVAVVHNHQVLDFMNFGAGLAAVLAGGGVAVGARSKEQKQDKSE
jgi:hypothetical protein